MRLQFFQKKIKISVSNLNSRRQTVLQKRFLWSIVQSCALILISERTFQSETKIDKIGQSEYAALFLCSIFADYSYQMISVLFL